MTELSAEDLDKYEGMGKRELRHRVVVLEIKFNQAKNYISDLEKAATLPRYASKLKCHNCGRITEFVMPIFACGNCPLQPGEREETTLFPHDKLEKGLEGLYKE